MCLVEDAQFQPKLLRLCNVQENHNSAGASGIQGSFQFLSVLPSRLLLSGTGGNPTR